jgi:hypothetical protein
MPIEDYEEAKKINDEVAEVVKDVESGGREYE